MSKGRARIVSDDELLQVIESHDDRAVTATEVAEEVEIGRAGTLKRLDTLHEGGEIERKKVGGNAVVWWLPQ